jgi:LysR family nitrogen assimilation transcriptional regulator
MELRQLRYLIGVCEAGGVLAASKTLHVAQPALSQSIASLESELGVQLFVRTNRGMSLTDAGRTMLAHARVVLADIERARSAVRHSTLDIRGEVVIGLPTTVALVATLPILRATRAQYPKLKLKIIESHSGFLTEWLRAGRLDLSVLFVSGNESAFEYRLLLEERLALVTMPQNTPATKEVSLRSLAARPLVLPAQEHGLRRIIDKVCAEHGLELEVIAEIDSLPNIKRAVQEGMASTILSPGAVADEVQAGHLAVTTITRPHISRQVACATSMTRPITPATAAMISLVTEQMQELVEQRLWPAAWIGDMAA